MKDMNKQQGFLTIVLVVFIVIIAFLGVAAAYLFTVSGNINLNSAAYYNAFYLAEAGLQCTVRELLTPQLAWPAVRRACNGYNLSDTSTLNPPGEFKAQQSTSIFHILEPTQLTSALSASTTTIPVFSTGMVYTQLASALSASTTTRSEEH